MITSVEDLYNLYLKFPAVSTDTRSIKEQSIFFSLKGDNFNGNKFAAEALAKGAAFAVVDEPEFCREEKYILVEDVFQMLQNLAIYHRKQLDIPVVGITGTNGKTTTKELIFTILNKKYKTISTAGNFNNHIGVPLTVLSCSKNTEIAIIEMGANHPGEIAQLCEIAKPNHGIITNIGKAHLEGFGSFDNIIETKNALYEYVRRINGVVFVNKDDTLLTQLSEDIERIFYGTDKYCQFYGKTLESNPFLNLKFKVQHSAFKILRTHFIGEYNFENILAAACIGNYFGVPVKDIKSAIENYIPAGYRSQFIETDKNKIIMDAYNANPSSMEAAINNFASLNFTNKIALIGDMFELGKEAAIEHEKIINLLKKQNFESIILIGPEFSAVNDGFAAFENSEEASAWLKANPQISKTILIKGSRGIKLEKVLEAL